MTAKQPERDVPAIPLGNREALVIFRNVPQMLAIARGVPLAESHPDYNDELAKLSLEIDRVMREQAPASWKGDARETQVLNALFPQLGRNREATKAVFELTKNQAGYG